MGKKDNYRSTAFMETVLDNIHESIATIDAHSFAILGVNRAFLEEYQLQEHEVIGRPCYEVTHQRSCPCTPPRDSCPLLETLQSGEAAQAEHIHYTRDREERHVEITTIPVKDAQGLVTQIIHIARDISARKMAEKQRDELIEKLSKALADVKQLSGLLPICSHCKNVRNDKGYWSRIEIYLSEHSEARFSHGICPDCINKLYPGLFPEDYKED